MENDPKTRQEKKGGKKGPKDSVYSSRRVRQLEAMIEQKGVNSSSTSKTPGKQKSSPSAGSKPRKK